MDDFKAELKAITTEYGIEATQLCINLAIEKFKDLRNYPAEYTDEQILADMRNNISKIAMAVVELDTKIGLENQISHSENGYNRVFKDGIIAYGTVTGLINTI